MEWLHRFLLKFSPYRRFIEWTKTLILPGFRPLPLYTVIVFFILEIQHGSLGNRASSLAFRFMLAVFPAIIFLFTLIPYIPFADFQQTMLTLIQLIMPHDAYLAFRSTINDIVVNQNLSLLSFGFLSALIFATNGVSNLMRAFNKSSLQLETRSWLKRRWVALMLTLVISFGFFIAIILLLASKSVIGFLQEHIFSQSNFWAMLYRW